MPEYLNIWSLEAQVNGMCIPLGFPLSRLSNYSYDIEGNLNGYYNMYINPPAWWIGWLNIDIASLIFNMVKFCIVLKV